MQKTADLLGSPEVAIDDRHGPKLYARFLEGLLSTPAASLDRPMSDKRKAKSVSPIATNKLELSPLKSLSQPSSARPSAEPEEHPVGPTMYTQHLTTDPHQMQDLENSSFMIQPLPFEELLQSMQSVTESPTWGDFGAMPGKPAFRKYYWTTTYAYVCRFCVDGSEQRGHLDVLCACHAAVMNVRIQLSLKFAVSFHNLLSMYKVIASKMYHPRRAYCVFYGLCVVYGLWVVEM